MVAAGDDGDCSGDDGVSSAWKQSAQLGARMQLRTGSTLALKQLMIWCESGFFGSKSKKIL